MVRPIEVPPPHRKTKRGFTLVELLVVIGIIAVLISVLLPTLSRARDAAARTQCLSNMRSVFQMLKMYEISYKGATLIGYSGSSTGTSQAGSVKQNNYFLSRTSTDPYPGTSAVRYLGFGNLFPARIVKEGEGRIFFCPVFDGDTNHGYNVPTNPWPPSSYPSTITGCRMAYSQRPFGVLETVNGGTPKLTNYVWLVSAPGQWGPFMWQGDVFNSSGAITGASGANIYPKLSKLKNVAIMSDINSSVTRVRIAHKKGINVLYASGGAHFVDMSSSAQLPANSPYPNPSNLQFLVTSAASSFSQADDKSQDAIWLTLDAQ